MRIAVAAGDAALAASVLDADEEVLRRTEPVVDGEVAPFQLEVDRNHRPIAVVRPAMGLSYAGVEVAFSRPLDIAETVSDAWLQERIGGPGPDRYVHGPFDPALFAIGGARFVQQLLDIVTDPSASLGYRARAADACLFALRNTPDAPLCRQVLEVAVQELHPALQKPPTRTRAPWHVTSLVEAVEDAVTQVAHWGFGRLWPVPQLPEELLTELLASSCRDLHWPVLKILAVVPETRSEHLASVVADVAVEHDAKKGPDAAVVAASAADALGGCPDTPAVQQALEVLSRSERLEVRLGAMGHLVRRGGHLVAKGLWEQLLQDRSLAQRLYASELIAGHGRAEDLPAAITALRQALKSKHTPRETWSSAGLVTDPPWGSELLTFLWRHREQPPAAAEIQRLRQRWPAIRPDLATWAVEHLPDLPLRTA
ncbi:hypothetical protein [Kineococcus xinjiangensis]|uniref:hypothetical protein n=1 Tax=Kineococcus xinjiangensis TaxID=512762 RepID=UPI001FE68607|nr:hypothetical protein [Kineococcus xinjiangensis]